MVSNAARRWLGVFLAYCCAVRLVRYLLSTLLIDQLRLLSNLLVDRQRSLARSLVDRAPLLSNFLVDRSRLFGHSIVMAMQ